VETQIKRTDSSWGSHNSQIGSASQVTLLHNPSNSKLYSDPGIGPHSLYAQGVCVKGECKIAKKSHINIEQFLRSHSSISSKNDYEKKYTNMQQNTQIKKQGGNKH